MHRSILTAVCCSFVHASLLSPGKALGQDKDLTARYTWKPVRIGAGGYVRGFDVNPSHPNVRLARADVGNMYRWDAAANTSRQRFMSMVR